MIGLYPVQNLLSFPSAQVGVLSPSFPSTVSSLRGKTNDYGLASNTTVPEKPVSFEISASIKPRIVTKGAITVPAPAALSPTLPKAIDFKPVTPKISTFTPNTITLDPINMPGTANGDEQYIYGNTTASNNTSSGSDDVAPISQQSITGGTMNITTNAGRTNIFSTGTSFVGVSGGATTQAARETNNGAKNLDIENNDSYAAMKNIGGQKITMNNVTFNYSGTGPTGANAYRRWLFHTDGHGDYGDTTWVLNGTNVNMNGKNLVMYYSQYHGNSSMHGNIGFVNNGSITTSDTGSGNYIWITAVEATTPGRSSNDTKRTMYFYNDENGKITLGGTKDMFTRVWTNSSGVAGGFSITNKGSIILGGQQQTGITFTDGIKYNLAEILLDKPITISGKKSAGIYFNAYAKLEGGETRPISTSINKVKEFSTPTSESILKVDITGEENSGLYFNYTGADVFNVKKYILNATGDRAKNNALVYVQDGTVTLAAADENKINITGGEKNTAIYNAATDTLTTAAIINVSNSNSSTGISSEAGTVSHS